MNKHLQVVLMLLMVICSGCKKTAPTTHQIDTKTQPELTTRDTTFTGTKSITANRQVPTQYEYRFVSAKQGLIYRDAPKGKMLGKFALNTQLKIIDSTKVKDRIREGDKTIEGEWLGVEKEADTVYVFNGFLSEAPRPSDIVLYYASSYYKEQNRTRTAFINLSDPYFETAYEEKQKSPILTDPSKDTIRLNQKQRIKLLTVAKVSEVDTIFIYEFSKDNITAFSVKEAPAIACINMYALGTDEPRSEEDYEFGFDLGKQYNGGDNIVFIGKENPFQAGKIKPLIWKKVDNTTFPTESTKWNGNGNRNTYLFTLKNFNYFINSEAYQQPSSHIERYHLAILDKSKTKVIQNKYYQSSESIYLYPLQTTAKRSDHPVAWTGEVFKNKPPIIYGLEGNSFGCPSIDFINETEPSIYIRCDNRH